jgi:predicted nucleotidyltransferase
MSKHRNLPWLDERTIFLTRHGSHAYGTSVPTSDLDIKGVAIAPREHYLGFSMVWEQAESKDPDMVVYELRKFLRLAADCNPSILEVLWTDPSDHLKVTPLGELLLEHRGLFLSRKAKHTFCGYAISQLKRIKAHRRWLLSPPGEPPARGAFGLPELPAVPPDQLAAAEAAVRKQLDSWELDLSGLDDAARIALLGHLAGYLTSLQITDEVKAHRAGVLLGYDTNFLEILDAERRYTNATKEWQGYQQWARSRNPARAELEARHGYDTKHAMHLVRLLRMCREILVDGTLVVRRPDADELLAIRHGAWAYDDLVTWAEAADAEMQVLVKTSPLPHAPSLPALDALCERLLRSALADLPGDAAAAPPETPET